MSLLGKVGIENQLLLPPNKYLTEKSKLNNKSLGQYKSRELIVQFIIFETCFVSKVIFIPLRAKQVGR